MERTLKSLAREAKQRMKKGFWKECEEELISERTHAKEQGINESKMRSEEHTSELQSPS